MKKTQLYTVIVLSFCSAQLDFMITGNYTEIFPRDRIMHTAISIVLAFTMLYLISYCNLSSKAAKIVAAAMVAARAVYMCSEFINYFHTFHGSGTVAIALFSVITAVLFWKYIYYRTHLLYSFFIMFNITLLILLVFLSAGKINVINIYSNSLDFNFAINKIPFMYDIITLSLIIEKRKDRIYAGKRFLLAAGLYMTFVTLLQGLCIKGNILYSVSPLQALVQTLYTGTVARFDYIFTIYYTLNYLAAVMLYSWALKQLFLKKDGDINEER